MKSLLSCFILLLSAHAFAQNVKLTELQAEGLELKIINLPVIQSISSIADNSFSDGRIIGTWREPSITHKCFADITVAGKTTDLNRTMSLDAGPVEFQKGGITRVMMSFGSGTLEVSCNSNQSYTLDLLKNDFQGLIEFTRK